VIVMDIHRLRVFKAVVDHGGFGRGAEAVHLTQPAASQAVRLLERDVGATLLTRGRPPELTAAGRRVYDHAADVLARDAAVRRDVDEIRKGAKGLLALGASQALSREVLPELVAAFHRRHPLAILHLETLPSREIIRVVADGRLELGLGPLQRSMSGFTVHVLGRQRMVLYAGRRSAWRRAVRREGAAALRRVALVTSHLDAPGTRPGSGQLRENFRTVWEVHSLDLRLRMVADGLAVGYLPDSIAGARRAGEALVPLEGLDFGVIERQVGLFHASKRPLSAAGEAFVAVARGGVEPPAQSW
jgi:DNA-binding transcriptional LysR family regulator